MIKSDIAWMNGKLVPFAEAKVHVVTHTLHYGLAAFEGIRCYKRADGRSAVFRLREHVDRLLESAKIATMDCGYTREQLEKACVDTLRGKGYDVILKDPLTPATCDCKGSCSGTKGRTSRPPSRRRSRATTVAPVIPSTS